MTVTPAVAVVRPREAVTAHDDLGVGAAVDGAVLVRNLSRITDSADSGPCGPLAVAPGHPDSRPAALRDVGVKRPAVALGRAHERLRLGDVTRERLRRVRHADALAAAGVPRGRRVEQVVAADAALDLVERAGRPNARAGLDPGPAAVRQRVAAHGRCAADLVARPVPGPWHLAAPRACAERPVLVRAVVEGDRVGPRERKVVRLTVLQRRGARCGRRQGGDDGGKRGREERPEQRVHCCGNTPFREELLPRSQMSGWPYPGAGLPDPRRTGWPARSNHPRTRGPCRPCPPRNGESWSSQTGSSHTNHRIRGGSGPCVVAARLGGTRPGEADARHDGADRIVGTARADVVRSCGGNDRIQGRGGKDRLSGGRGKDRIAGGSPRPGPAVRRAGR